jgi:predicted N-acyltransferase
MSTQIDIVDGADHAADLQGYRLEISEHVSDLNSADWDSLPAERDAAFMDRRFIAAVETSRPGGQGCWSALVYFRDRPVAAACFSLFKADAAIVASNWVKRLAERIRRVFPNYLRFKVLFCGLPVSAGESHLIFSRDADRRKVLQLLDIQIRKLARRHGAKILIFKEFDEEEFAGSVDLESLGYQGVQSTVANELEHAFASFDDYFAAMRSRYRRNIIYSQRKFAEAGFRIETLMGAGVADRYTDEVHQLYEAVWEQAENKLELLPAEFFRELARRFPEDFFLILASRGEKVVGCFTGIRTPGVGASLFVGLDYEFNGEGDIYFNLFFEFLRETFSHGVRRIHLGATAYDFKARLGSRQRRNYIFITATNWLRWPLRWFSRQLFPPLRLEEPLHVFRDPPAGAKAESRVPSANAVDADA